MLRTILTCLVLLHIFLPSISLALPVGTLVHDGPATPEQLSLLLPITGALPTTATARVRYKTSTSSTWVVGHPLHRIRPDLATTDGAKAAIINAFAWPIIGLFPGTTYDVEVTVTSGGDTDVKTATFTTRSLPAAAGPVNKIIASGSTAAQIQAVLDTMNPGDVIEFANGTYNLSTQLSLNRSGTAAQPIYIRGQSRKGVTLKNSSRIWYIVAANHIVIENMTIEGSGIDSGTTSSSLGISFSTSGGVQTRVTVRNITMNGVDQGVVATKETQELLVYDNTLAGNNTWTQDFYAHGGGGTRGAGDGIRDLEQNVFWNDDGIRLPGFGNVAFNNTLRGFGDAMAFCQHNSDFATAECRNIHYYRNDILMTGDDGTEADYAFRNLSFYDNRIHNSMTFISLDPLYGGPFVAARNISINAGRSPYKFNNTNTGHFIYNNTVVRTTGNTSGWGWLQPTNGSQRAWGYQNNIFIYQGTGGKLMAFESAGNNPIDWTHNSFFPDEDVWWTNSGSSYANLAAAYAGLAATTPVFSGITRRHEADHICEADPFATDVVLGGDFRTELTTYYTPTLSTGTTPRGSGIKIENVTDGFSGAAPDRGAMITGIPVPQWGDRTASSSSPAPVSVPEQPANLQVQ